ncbi:uncharacterized protein E0L32_005663 [Thyridium curvatum]|uniref:Uncharacterized protein n=1 Tax=Thyridium curvatum TaxID=1093900 RepID=A0A507B260_9PEZI|nr:uncharacterized protein E0L32_005663 [Thyridium curvatum]TPX13963.1 hypothetical protein E0L32_005663 [Thyridium curvatum]
MAGCFDSFAHGGTQDRDENNDGKHEGQDDPRVLASAERDDRAAFVMAKNNNLVLVACMPLDMDGLDNTDNGDMHGLASQGLELGMLFPLSPSTFCPAPHPPPPPNQLRSE